MSSLLVCKVCGKKYPGCQTINRTNTMRWQDVACCPEHGSIYFARIIESRKSRSNGNAEVNNVVDYANTGSSELLSQHNESFSNYNKSDDGYDDEELDEELYDETDEDFGDN